MAEKLEVYKCEGCGIIVEVLEGGGGTLVCCGNDMELLDEQTADFTTEKHVPVIEETENGYKVVVGSTPHPMEEEHYIQWIELQCDCGVMRCDLEPGDAPEVSFCACCKGEVSAREYCNVHGLWKS